MKKKQVFGNGCGFWERLRERLRKKSRFFFLIIQVFCFKKTKKTPVLLVFYALFAY